MHARGAAHSECLARFTHMGTLATPLPVLFIRRRAGLCARASIRHSWAAHVRRSVLMRAHIRGAGSQQVAPEAAESRKLN